MSTTYDAAVGLGTPGAGDSPYAPILDANRATIASYLAMLAVRPVEIPSASLSIKVAAGTYAKHDGTIATYAGSASYGVSANTTTYLWLTEAGVLSSGAAWPSPGVWHIRLAVIVSGATTITSITPWQLIPRAVSA